MAQPTPYTRQYVYEDEQSDNPLQPVAGAHMDTEFDAIKETIDQTLENLALLQRDDGALKNGIVTLASLSSDTQALISAGTVRGTWTTATVYAIGDLVEHSTVAYFCILAHTSGTFATDLAALKWCILTGTVVADNSVSTVKIVNDAVTEDKLADDAVTNDKVADDAIDTPQLVDEAVTNAKLALTNGFSLKGQVVGASGAAPVDLTMTQALAGLAAFIEPGHRLSLSGSSVPSTDQTAATAIRWTPHKHNLTPLYDGTRWGNYAVAEISLTLDADSGHTGYHQSGKNFCLFVDYNAGTPRLVSGPAWTSDTGRVAAGDIVRESTYGRYVNNATITVRFGAGASDTVSKAAGSLLWVGTFRASANGQTEDSAAKRFLWNLYNRVLRFMRVTEATNTWVYATATIRQVNGSTANQLDFVRGLDEDPVKVFAKSLFLADTIGEQGRIMMGLDSTTVMATGCLPGVVQCDVALQIEELNASWHGLPGLGRHYLAWLEYGTAGHVITWSGDAGVPTLNQAGIHGEVWA